MRQVIMLIILAAMMRYACVGTGRPTEHDGKDKTTYSPSLCYSFFNVTKNVTLRAYFTKKLNCGNFELNIGTG